MGKITLVNPREINCRVSMGDAILVCAYPDDRDFKNNRLKKALSFQDFASRMHSLSKKKEIVFYCDSENESVSTDMALKTEDFGFENVKVLKGGVTGWKEAGLE